MQTQVVTASALIARINRELNLQSTITKTCTPGAGFVLTNLRTGNVKPMTLRDLEDMARELGVLADFEILTAPPVPPIAEADPETYFADGYSPEKDLDDFLNALAPAMDEEIAELVRKSGGHA